ncbi:MAG TPA: hypothetical protein VFM98_14385 [Ramlibacter sp.]|uniref:hypothetical protein n=1 Tax=Ramlibacter sp. TaxID=1917967 RepID=UPI002D7E8BDD|nr:hypothetical protein [Ramlibacter sp.]HET8746791.1 hypothetical protein [Ramlibacter sp.]
MGNSKHAPAPGGPQDKAEIEAVLDRIARRVKELKAFDPSGIQDRWDTRLEVLQKNVNKTIAEAVGMGSAQYRQLAIGPLDAALESAFGDRFTLEEMRDVIRKAVGQAAMRLNAAAKVLERRLAGGSGDSTLAPLGDAPASNFGALPSNFAPLPPSNFAPLAADAAAPSPAPASPSAPASATTTPSMETNARSATPRIAIVCRDDATGEAVTSFVAQLGLEPVIAQQPGASASLDALEALRHADFALVLQAERQLEIGFLLGALGRSRLCVLNAGGAQDSLPGLPHQALDEGGLWKLLVARELKKSGLAVDLNKAL